MQELQRGDPERLGPYRLVGRLGSGGMGRVFLGRSAGGRLVAVKVIRDELAADPNFRVRFGREVAAARRVGGLFTALVVDADTDGPTPWLATAYVAAPSLADAVSASGPLPPASVLSLAAGLAEGLVAIHEVGLVHRDLKPSNVLLADDGPRVIDFGISRAAEASALTRTGSVIGSPGFMSPEQAEGDSDIGPASDVFSLGAVLVFAATGLPPFGVGSTAALVYRVVFSPPRLDDVPWQVRPIAERCLVKDPRQRPTPAELLAEFGDVEDAATWLPSRVREGFVQHAPPAPADIESPPRSVPAGRVGQSDSATAAPDAPDTVTGSRYQPEKPLITQPPPVGNAAQPQSVEPRISTVPAQDGSAVAPPITHAAPSGARPPINRRLAYIGTLTALVAGIGGVISQLFFFYPFHITAGVLFYYFLFSLAIFVLVMIAALVALTRIYRLTSTGFLQGMLWLGAPSLVTIVVRFLEFSGYNGRALYGWLIEVASLALAVIAAIVLMISWSPAIKSRPVRQIRGLPLLLLGVAGLSQIVLLVFYVRLGNYLISADYYAAGSAGVPVALAVTWYAMSLRSRALGGALVLGWVTAAAAVFASELAFDSPILDRVSEFWAVLGYVLLAAVVVLTVSYMRKPSDPATAPP